MAIETKRHGGNTAKGEQQLDIWHAAHWEFLISRVGAEAVDDLGFLPGVVVQGHIWSLIITTRRQATTVRDMTTQEEHCLLSFNEYDADSRTCLQRRYCAASKFGNTGSVVGVFQVLAGLQLLRQWSLEVLWPWYKQHLPGLSDNGSSVQQASERGGTES